LIRLRRPGAFAAKAVVGVMAGLTMFAVNAAPAGAHVVHAYHGSRGHAWTNTAHTRLGLEDTNCDGLRVRAEYREGPGPWDIHLVIGSDPNGCDPGHGAWEVGVNGITGWQIRVCTETRGCGNWQDVT
jgi:hypothetical protein